MFRETVSNPPDEVHICSGHALDLVREVEIRKEVLERLLAARARRQKDEGSISALRASQLLLGNGRRHRNLETLDAAIAAYCAPSLQGEARHPLITSEDSSLRCE